MSKGQWAFRAAALKRAIKTAQDAGLTVSGFRINPQGEIHVETVGHGADISAMKRIAHQTAAGDHSGVDIIAKRAVEYVWAVR